ncbi:MAG: rhomboid family intramembrane serine protease [Armatimonadetes bacterium]|nr:rhomboid family intramembrane serine protease [Armatimonadota bacterium]MDW8121195.1 rhomboid family intramembrane serine protease [Armatimonadota bacterium]
MKDDIPSRSFPFVTYSLIVVNSVIFLYEVSLGPHLQEFLELVAVIPAEYKGFLSGDEVPTIKLLIAPFASMFLHGGWMHLIGNMWFLYLFGDNVEDRMGHFRFFMFYIITGLAATAAHIVTNFSSPLPTIGASGAISGVVGAYAILFPSARILTLVIFVFFADIVLLPAFIYIGLWFLIQLWSGVLSLAIQTGGIAWWAHIGGFLAGLLLSLDLAARRSRKESYYFYPR